jgi:isocitrate/isopropylmalate dehydrogenase
MYHRQFDVLVTTNLFADILSHEIAGLVVGMGVTPGVSVGEMRRFSKRRLG